MYRRSESSEENAAPRNAAILLDTIGELSACWGLADIAFVGGSFGPRGGQNMLEPAAHGAAVLFGPNTWNFKDIVDQLRRAEAAVQLQTQDEFLPTVKRLLSDADARNRLGQNARKIIVAQQGAVEKTTRLLCDELSGGRLASRDAA
ncbi:MAG TPA: hypothetical protein EYQ63_15970 [Fuerstia sp.]|nr:hypothetical protein [Fuerstiella sp.]